MAIPNMAGFAGPQMTPEERQLKNERSRVNGFIRSYERNPGNWNPSMIASLEKLALQYQIPFKRHIPKANILQNVGAATFGALDALALDFVPDKWYSSEATRKAKNIGKGVGVVGGALLTGGASLGAKGAIAGGKVLGSKLLARGAQKIGGTGVAKATAQYTPLGFAGRKATEAFQRLKGGAQVGAGKKLADSKAIIKSIKDGNIGDVTSLLKGRVVGRGDIGDITKVVNQQFGKGSLAANKILARVKASTDTGLKLGKDKIKALVNRIGARSESAVKNVNVTGDQMKNFIKIAGRRNKMSSKEIKDLLTLMEKQGIKNLDEAAEFILNSGKSSSNILNKAMSLTDLKSMSKTDLAILAAGSLGATRGLTGIGGSAGLTPSRSELEAEDLDIYNPL